MFPGLFYQPLFSWTGLFGLRQKTRSWLTPPVLKGWLCYSLGPSSARGKLFNHAETRKRVQRWALYFPVWKCVSGSKGICLLIHVQVCLLLLFISNVVHIFFSLWLCLPSHSVLSSTLLKTLQGKPYQLDDVWVLSALIDSIYLYTLPL